MEKKVIIVISLVLVISFSVVGATIFIFYEDSKETSGYYEISTEGKIISELEIDNQIKKGNINFMTLSENSSNILEAEWTINYKGFNDPEKFIVITYEEQQSILKIFSALNMPDDIIDLDLNIFFNPNFNNYSFKSDSGNGNIKFNTHKINYSVFEIKTSSGNVDVQLNKSSIYNDFKISTNSGDINLILDHSIFSKDFLCTSDSGDQWFDIWNIRFISYSDFNASALSGRVNVKWANHFNKSHKININLFSPSDVLFKMWTPIEITKFDIFYEAINGTTQFSKVTGQFEEIGFNHYHSNNINKSGIDFCNISAITTYGKVHVFIVDCFKWQRFCSQTQDFWPYDVRTSGEYVIPKEDHIVTTIEFYNLNYMCLNRTEYLDINFIFLPASSEYAIHLVWDLTYQHAMGTGVGFIEVLTSNKTEGNTLKFYIDLGYELDRIIPTFSKCNVTAFIHPSYSFYNYTI
ncbi:MAG TPA: hypothetical protein VMV43_03465 [Candidatus Nanopelagicaceae bacterium]|nr:hypothetical protein [Candidatus Nanopelagicaceae bacterium]